MKVNWKVAQSCRTLCNPMDCSPSGFSVHGDSPGQNTGVGSCFLLQGIFPTQGSNPGLLHCRRILYCLSRQESHQGNNVYVFTFTFIQHGGFPGGASSKEPTCQCRTCKRRGLDPWVVKTPWRRAWQLTLVFLPRESYGQRSLGYYGLPAHKALDTTKHAWMWQKPSWRQFTQEATIFLRAPQSVSLSLRPTFKQRNWCSKELQNFSQAQTARSESGAWSVRLQSPYSFQQTLLVRVLQRKWIFYFLGVHLVQTEVHKSLSSAVRMLECCKGPVT